MTAKTLSVDKLQKTALAIGGVGIVLCGIGAFLARQQFFTSYLFAFLFWFGLATGCLGILLLHHVTGGAWGDLIKPQLEAASLTLPLLGLLFLPILLGMPVLFPWARPELVAQDPVLQHKQLYLNIPFFCARAVVYFLVLSLMATRLSRWSASQVESLIARAQRRSAPGLIVYTVILTFAVLDWMMSLEPAWYSTIYEALVIIGFMLTAFAFVTCGLRVLMSPPAGDDVNVKPFHDLGNMVLAFVMFWAYMAFSQYLIIWSANLPEEITWYRRRQAGGWFGVAMVLIFFQFILPFLILLGRRNKQRLDRLGRVAGIILALGVLNVFWQVKPAFYPAFHLHWLDAAAFAGAGGVWLATFLAFLKRRPAMVGTYIPEEAA